MQMDTSHTLYAHGATAWRWRRMPRAKIRTPCLEADACAIYPLQEPQLENWHGHHVLTMNSHLCSSVQL